MSAARKIAAAACMLLPPLPGKNLLMRCFGWRIAKGCRLGMSWIEVKRVNLALGARIGYGNIVRVDALHLDSSAYIGHLNQLNGPFIVALKQQAGVGNSNRITRARLGATWGRSMLRLGTWSKITSGHVIDCTRSVRFGDYSTLAGKGSQVWTHGYLHAPAGIDRFRIDGRVHIGSNVYVGSASVINAGVRIGDAITIGSMSCVSSSLATPGLYVGQQLRMLRLDYEDAYQRHPAVHVAGLQDRVVNKHLGPGR